MNSALNSFSKTKLVSIPEYIKIGIAFVHNKGNTPFSNLSMNLIRELAEYLIQRKEKATEESAIHDL